MLTFVAMPPAVVEAVMSARQEVRARTVLDQAVPLGLDTETSLSGTLQLRARHSRSWLTYAPRLTLRDLGRTVATSTLIHGGATGFTYFFRHATLTLQEDATYGEFNAAGATFATSATSGLPVVQTFPTAVTIGVYSSATTLSGSYSPARYWTMRSSASYSTSGALEEKDSALFPRQYGPRASLEAGYAASRRSGLLIGTAFTRTLSSNRAESTTVSVTTGWSYLLARRTTSALTAGFAVIRAREAPQLVLPAPGAPPPPPSPLPAFTTAVVPVMTASVTHRPSPTRESGRYTATVTLAPTVDRLTGNVYLRVDGSLAGVWRLAPRTTFQAIMGGSQSVESFGQPAITVAFAETSIGYSPRRWVRFDTGGRASYQHIGGTTFSGSSSPSQAAIFAGVTVTDTERLLP